jgi:hypothetical protein
LKHRESAKRKRHELTASSQSEPTKTTVRTITFETGSDTGSLSPSEDKATDEEANPGIQDNVEACRVALEKLNKRYKE